MRRRTMIRVLAASPVLLACNGTSAQMAPTTGPWPGPQRPTSFVGATAPPIGDRLVLDDAEWRRRLTREQYEVLRQQGTEPAFSGAYWNEHRRGTYHCAGCGNPLFHSR